MSFFSLSLFPHDIIKRCHGMGRHIRAPTFWPSLLLASSALCRTSFSCDRPSPPCLQSCSRCNCTYAMGYTAERPEKHALLHVWVFDRGQHSQCSPVRLAIVCAPLHGLELTPHTLHRIPELRDNVQIYRQREG